MKTTTCYVIQARTETFTNVNWKLLLPIETVLSALMRDVLLFTASLTSPLRRCIKKSCECLRDKQTNSSAEQCKFSAQKKKLRWLGTEKKSEVICARAKYFALRRACVPKRKGKEKQRAARAVAVVLPLMKLTSPRSTLPAFSLLASLISLDDRLLAQVLSFLSLAVFLRNSPRKVFTHSRCQFHNHIRLQEDPKKKKLGADRCRNRLFAFYLLYVPSLCTTNFSVSLVSAYLFFSVRFVAFRLCALNKYANKNFYTNNLKCVLADFSAVYVSGQLSNFTCDFSRSCFCWWFPMYTRCSEKSFGLSRRSFFLSSKHTWKLIGFLAKVHLSLLPEFW